MYRSARCHTLARSTATFAFTLGLLAMVGCQSDPIAPRASDRIDSYETTRADRESTSASIPAMLEFSDQTADRLALEIADLPRIAAADHRLLLELGTIDNQTRTPTRDFEQIQRRLRSRLINSDVMRNHFVIVEDLRRVDRELERIGAGDNDLLQEGSGTSGTRYDPEHTYMLSGDFYESRRGDRRQYWFEFRLLHVGSREIILSSDFDLAQTR
ncbi:MAG: hypothetical protein WD009_07940 [Phycisphaeraceae bacterium]